jgi:hypothetical protein
MNRRELISVLVVLCFCLVSSACRNNQQSDIATPYPEIEFLPNGTSSLAIPSLNGNQISLHIVKPDGDGPFPVLIGIAGGDGMYAFYQLELPERLRQSGIVTVDFAPQGRGISQGQDNYHGHVHQDDLKAVVDFVSQLPFAQKDNIGVISFSYGVTLATGALARYPNMPVAFLIDWEGPSCPAKDIQRGIKNDESWAQNIVRLLSGGEEKTAHEYGELRIHGGALSDEAYWVERDASRFAGELPCPYLRVQFDVDHAQGPYKYHMMEIINAVTERSKQWTRCNDNPANVIYTESDLSKYHFHQYEVGELPGLISTHKTVEKVLQVYIEEMFFSRPFK